jgi:hypothetical protein
MKNFETAQVLIEELQAENEKLKQKIAQLSECDISIQVDSSRFIAELTRESTAAMARFTKRIRNEIRNHQEKSNG